jgi:hypothetical protein
MKKMMAIVMALVMAAGMTACGDVKEISSKAGAMVKNTAEVQNTDEQAEKTQESEGVEMGSIEGGWNISDETDIDKNPEAKAALENALENMLGAEYVPVAVLGTQVVAGTNYCILCKVTAVYPDAKPDYVMVYVYEDPEGNAEITDTKDITLGDTENNYAETGEEIVQIPNPWTEYKSAEEAGKEAGLAFDVPEKLGENSISLIQSMDGLAEVTYGSGDNEISYRKGRGTEDISGDYNNYNEMTEMDINGMTITLRGNDGRIFGAVWDDGEYSYSYYVTNGVSIGTAQADITALINENTK